MRDLFATSTTHAAALAEANLREILTAIAALKEGNRADLSANVRAILVDIQGESGLLRSHIETQALLRAGA